MVQRENEEAFAEILAEIRARGLSQIGWGGGGGGGGGGVGGLFGSRARWC